MLEHRYVMQQWLGRPLLQQEQVHHRDGSRAHNSIENLELKSGAHGSGINIIDGIYSSLDWIERYSGLDLVEKAAIKSIRSKAQLDLLGPLGPSKHSAAPKSKRSEKV